ncbi:S-adenosyl-L-methionine-dependent methyltransferase [Armillaria novae-zelandiae]|uniref:S-adenosyl-L-methionine-dependent methyltransferase n=1 Tax=Armillaria novae-zelandiae TaxID=153914 RepID=A0AA39P2I7_9AGAR|nr:S-adenosyl-L-methionine-dependent methyltransferase [Armillaria novae-zelandiae]
MPEAIAWRVAADAITPTTECSRDSSISLPHNKCNQVVEDTFAETARPDVPSLDDTTPHPLDSQVLSIEMREAIQTIEGACAQLCALVARPNRTVLNIVEPACIRVVVNFNIADHLLDKPEGLHISDLGALSGAEPRKLGRILRLLASKHCFREVDRDIFANNRLSMMLLSTNGLSSLADFFTDESNKALSMLTETLKDPDWGHSYSPLQAPFNYWTKYPGTIYSWYQRGALCTDGATVCDVGGGIGVTSMQLADTHPNLRIVLQDLPSQIEIAKHEGPVEDGRVEFKAIDFFKESAGRRLHNWPDNECKAILKSVGNAMSVNSRLLIFDYVIQHADRDTKISESAGLEPAPEPLLPNYGAGRIFQYNLDVDMMCVCNSQERTLDHFIKLGKEAGLKFVRVWDAREASIIEFCLQ